MTEKMGKTVRRAAFALLLAGTATGGLALGGHFYAQAQPDVAQPKPGAIQPSQLSHPLPDFVDLVKQVKPAVVSITSKMRPEEDQQGGGMPGMGGQGQQTVPVPVPLPVRTAAATAAPHGRSPRLGLPDRCRRHRGHQ